MVRRYTPSLRPLSSNWPQIGTPARAQHLLRTEFVSPFRSTMSHVMSDKEPNFVVVHDEDEKEVILPRVEGRYVDDTKRQKKKILAKIEELRIWTQTGDEWSKRWLKNLEKDLEALRINKSRRYTINQPLGHLFIERDLNGEEKHRTRKAREFAVGHRDNDTDRSWKVAGNKRPTKMRGAKYEHEPVLNENGNPSEYMDESLHKFFTRCPVARKQWMAKMKLARHSNHSFNAMLWLGWEEEMSLLDMIASEREYHMERAQMYFDTLDIEQTIEAQMWSEIAQLEREEKTNLLELEMRYNFGMDVDTSSAPKPTKYQYLMVA